MKTYYILEHQNSIKHPTFKNKKNKLQERCGWI